MEDYALLIVVFDLETETITKWITIAHYREVIKRVFKAYAEIPYAYDDIQQQIVVDETNDHYMLVNVGWDKRQVHRIHGTLVHLDIIDGKIWVQRDGTEYGIAQELVDAGIPKSQIVLAFHPSYKRPHTEFAVA